MVRTAPVSCHLVVVVVDNSCDDFRGLQSVDFRTGSQQRGWLERPLDLQGQADNSKLPQESEYSGRWNKGQLELEFGGGKSIA